jgi:hypothetical protein
MTILPPLGPKGHTTAAEPRKLVVDFDNELKQDLRPLSGFLGGRRQDRLVAGDDNCLGNIVTKDGQPYPSYHVYRMYAQTRGHTRVATEGCDEHFACLASKQRREKGTSFELLVGAVEPVSPVEIVLKGKDVNGATLDAWKIPADAVESDVEKPQQVLRQLQKPDDLVLQRGLDTSQLNDPRDRASGGLSGCPIG